MQTMRLGASTNETVADPSRRIVPLHASGNSKSDSILVLSDGSFFLGKHFGADRESIGELVFSTSMTGYQESLTDPSYAGQILTFCYPLQGNYGINKEDFESDRVQVRAVVAREVCDNAAYSHFKAGFGYGEYLESQNVPGIYNVDTRAIVRKVREAGVMPAAISPIETALPEKQLKEKIANLQSKLQKFDYGAINYVADVCVREPQVFSPKGKIASKVALIDCGVKMSIIRELIARGAEVTAFPYNVSADAIPKYEPDGLLISNGPGDPELMAPTISTVKALMDKLPMFGICLGHQILGHALGGKTFKLKFGHRGGNHAVLNPKTGKVYITTQNHGYSVHKLPLDCADALFVNCNDGTNEGLFREESQIISSQFHPEGACGPRDANFLFDEFLKMMK